MHFKSFIIPIFSLANGSTSKISFISVLLTFSKSLLFLIFSLTLVSAATFLYDAMVSLSCFFVFFQIFFLYLSYVLINSLSPNRAMSIFELLDNSRLGFFGLMDRWLQELV